MNEDKSHQKNSQETILVLCAHPDDEVIGPGATLAKYAKEGKRVIVVIYSYGENGNWWLKGDYTRELREKESKRAGAIIGTHKTIFLGLKDLTLKQEVEKPEVIARLKRIIKEYSPVKIFTHSFDDIVYQDHKAVHDSSMKLLKQINYKGDIYAFNIWGKDIRTTSYPKLLVDVSKTFNLKIKAIKEFKSQNFLVLWQLLPGIYFRALKQGFENKCRFAERFIKLSLDDK